MASRYDIQAVWGPRRETPEQVAPRFRRMIDALSAIGPIFSDWQVGYKQEFVPLASLSDDHVMTAIADGVSRDDLGEPTPINGFYFHARNGHGRPRTLVVDMRVGNYSRHRVSKNYADITTTPLEPEQASFLHIGMVRPAILALDAAWDIDWCQAYPWDLMPLWTKPWRSRLELAWMTYLSPRLAALVTPPRTAIVERPPGGGLLMIATEARFSSDDPAHVAVARDIKDAMAPVNALPWPLVTG